VDIPMKNKTVCIPLAKAFSKHLKTIGFDVDYAKIDKLNNSNGEENIEFTTDPSKIKLADFVIIAVPTPVTKSNLRSQTCDT
jgi:UDPglucose 6-dehydrogenase/UDP-N-acetyl-D-galactosamine dehydrogenase